MQAIPWNLWNGTSDRNVFFKLRLVRWRLKVGRRLRPWVNRRVTQCLLDALCAALAVSLAYRLRFDFDVPPEFAPFMHRWTAVLALAWPGCLAVRGGYRATWQHFGFHDMRRLAMQSLPLGVTLFLVRLLTPGRGVIPYTVVVLELGLMLSFSGGIRMLRRVDHEAMRHLSVSRGAILIATEATVAAALRQLRSSSGARVLGILASEPGLRRRKIDGVSVLGGPEDLVSVVAQHKVEWVILASTELVCIPFVLRVAGSLGISVRMMPSADDLLHNKVQVSKRISVDDLQISNSISPERLHPSVEDCVRGKVVLITGAGGSIGSEISRQVAMMPVKRLLLLDHDENSVFELIHEIRNRDPLVPVILDIRDAAAVQHLFARERPNVVLHAAAYKHVPLMEQNPCEAVLNNVFGTQVLAGAAIRHRCERMVMISSDKAVQPSSVMGASKRLAELVVQDACAQQEVRGTRFACVRFGNVLGSRGSVLPLFLKQIEAGGPITVTEREMTRYFMTIPQAVRLVLQATTLADAGEIFMLDMGNPVSIMSFAENVIRSSGLMLNRDITISITGARPGEKIHERLWSDGADVVETEFAQVLQVKGSPVRLDPRLCERLQTAAQKRQIDTVRELLFEAPIGYRTDSAEASSSVEEQRSESFVLT